MKDIYKMKLHQMENITPNGSFTEQIVQKVPGGWNYIYTFLDDKDQTVLSVQFVPWHDSGRQIENTGNYEKLKAKLKKAGDDLDKAEEALYQISMQNVQSNPVNQKVIRHILTEYYGDK